MERTKRSSPTDGIDLDDEFRPLTCPNCGTPREGEYCHGCGQRFLKDRLIAKELWWLFAERFLDWEEGVWRTFLKMATSPGVVIRRFLGGQRKTYLNPFSYLLFCVALYVGGQFLMRQVGGVSGIPGVKEFRKLGVAATNIEDQFSLIAYGTVLAVAILAIAMRIMFDGRLLNAMEAVVTAVYTSANVFILALAVSVVEFLFTGNPLSIYGLITTFVILFPLCMGHAGYGMFEGWGMACYTGLSPIVAVLFLSVIWFLGMGVFMIVFSGMEGLTSASGITGLLVILGGPGLVLLFYIFDFLS